MDDLLIGEIKRRISDMEAIQFAIITEESYAEHCGKILGMKIVLAMVESRVNSKKTEWMDEPV